MFLNNIINALNKIDEWIVRIQGINKDIILPLDLQQQIILNLEDSMSSDFNLIIEEFGFYQIITPKMKTHLVNQIFKEF